ncbi:MAG: ABC transporter ATP-binding protein [Lachnospirales bacterium]
MNKPLLEVKNLSKKFKMSKGYLQAVKNLNLEIYEGETLGLVGESGCGKSTAGRAILRLYDDNISGAVLYNGVNVLRMDKKEMVNMRKDMQLIFQDPYAALNGRMTVESIIAEPLNIHGIGTPSERKKRVEELLQRVGLKAEHRNRFPHEFSGGQRQRICIARALAVGPKFVVCDEPIASLDVSIQAQVVNLLKELQDEENYTYLFIAHDLSMVKYISDRILVMYLGNMMELAESIELTENPMHPYTKALLNAVPVPNPEYVRDEELIEGEIPNPMNPPSGCVFRTRCPRAMEICSKEIPTWHEAKPNHMVACHLYK